MICVVGIQDQSYSQGRGRIVTGLEYKWFLGCWKCSVLIWVLVTFMCLVVKMYQNVRKIYKQLIPRETFTNTMLQCNFLFLVGVVEVEFYTT